MKNRFLVLFLTLAVFLGFAMIASPVVFAAELTFGRDAIQARIGCAIDQMIQQDVADFPVDFLEKSTILAELDEMGETKTVEADELESGLDKAAKEVLGEAQNNPLNLYPDLTGEVIAFFDSEAYDVAACDVAEAFGEEEVAALTVEGRDLFNIKDLGERNSQQLPIPGEDFVYYGKLYNLDQDIDTGRSTNGLLYFSDEELLKFDLSATWELQPEPTAQCLDCDITSYEAQLRVDIPPFIAPLLVPVTGGYGGTEYGTFDPPLEDIPEPVCEDGSYELSMTYTPPALFAEPEVYPAGRYYRYTWSLFDESEEGDLQTTQVPIPEPPTFSATLYKNIDNQDQDGDGISTSEDGVYADNWIVFHYDDDITDGERGAQSDGNGPPDYYGAFVGLSPGVHLAVDFEGDDYFDPFADLTAFDFSGGSGHPGEDENRFPYLMDLYEGYYFGLGSTSWGGYGFDLSEQTGRPLPDIYWDLDPDTGFVQSENPSYMFIGEAFFSECNEFDLDDSFLIWKPYQAVAEYLEREVPNGSIEVENGGYGYGSMDDYDFRMEDTPHKYAVTWGNHEMIVDMDSLDQAIANVEDSDLLAKVDDYYCKYDTGAVSNGGGPFVGYGEIIKHGEYKPGWFGPYQWTEDTYDMWYGPYYNQTDGQEYWNDLEDENGNWVNPIYNYTEWDDTGNEVVYRAEFGLQTVGYGGYGYEEFNGMGWDDYPEVFTDGDIIDRLNQNGFLAYAVQVEEDIVNQKIIEMAKHRDELKARVTTNKAQDYDNIRARDAVLTKMADAQSGRVLKDKHGNWVRSQQYVLRPPDTNTVQVLNVCLRAESQLSTMDFTTEFKETLPDDLKDLPWSDYLNTLESPLVAGADGEEIVRYVMYDPDAPELDNMYVEFKNPAEESLKESREFGDPYLESMSAGVEGQLMPQSDVRQNVSDTLTLATLNGGGGEYTYGDSYTIEDSCYGFDYVLAAADEGADPTRVNVAFTALDSWSEDPPRDVNCDDMWDALSIDLSPSDGRLDDWRDEVLEIAIDEEGAYFSEPIDVVYIPMSRMLWKELYD